MLPVLPNTDSIIACPHCNFLVRVANSMDWEDPSARVWTDGKQESSLVPDPPQVIRCAGCEACYWVDQGEKQGEVPSRLIDSPLEGYDSAWIDAPEAIEPSEEEYLDSLEKGLARDPVEERTVRIFAWWRGNDRHREDGWNESLQTATGPRRANLEALAHLLEGAHPTMMVMKAEILRHLGEFEEARKLLGLIPKGQLDPIVQQLRLLCEARDQCVREFNLVHD